MALKSIKAIRLVKNEKLLQRGENTQISAGKSRRTGGGGGVERKSGKNLKDYPALPSSKRAARGGIMVSLFFE